MGLKVVVVGIPGVGKSTIVSKAIQGVPDSSLVVFGTTMFEEATKLGWVKHRDEMRKLTVEKQKSLQKIAAERISNTEGPVIIVDTHLFIRTPEGFWPGLPYDVIMALKPTHLILIEATPAEIQVRRQNDTTRYRDTVTLEDIQAELSLARSFLSAASLVSGAPMSFIRNAEGKADEASAGIVQVVRGAR